MGELLGSVLAGILCQSCGRLMEDLILDDGKRLKQAPGHPRTCEDCLTEEEIE